MAGVPVPQQMPDGQCHRCSAVPDEGAGHTNEDVEILITEADRQLSAQYGRWGRLYDWISLGDAVDVASTVRFRGERGGLCRAAHCRMTGARLSPPLFGGERSRCSAEPTQICRTADDASQLFVGRKFYANDRLLPWTSRR